MSLVTHLTTGERRVAQRRHQPELVDRQAHDRGDMVDRMRADDEAHRQRLAGGGARFVDRAQIARRDQVDAGFAAATQHQAAHADIGPAGLRIDHEVDRGGDVGGAVGAVPEMDRKRGEIGVVAGEHDLLRRRLGARDLDHVRLVAQPPQQLGQELVRLDAEGARDPRAAAGDVADEFLPSRGRPRGTAPPWDCLRGWPRRRRDPSPRSRSPGHRPALRRSGAGGSGRHRPASTALRPVSFQRCPFLRCPVAVFGAVDYSQTRGCNHKRCPRPIGNGVAQGRHGSRVMPRA